MISAEKCLDTHPALIPCFHRLFVFLQESKHFKDLEQPHSEVVQVTTALVQYLHSQSCIPCPMHSNNCTKHVVFYTQSTPIA